MEDKSEINESTTNEVVNDSNLPVVLFVSSIPITDDFFPAVLNELTR
jgi:hypothetical protein